jgi:transcriptional regulator with XRE-family HTH domain
MAEDSGPKAGQTDLWGEPWVEPKDRRGRKAHRKNPQVAEKVAVLIATGSTQEEIAAIVGLSVPTLNKYYFKSLSDGAAIIRGVVNLSLVEEAKKGKVAAARLLIDQIEKGDASAPMRRARRAAQVQPPAETQPVGKKATAHAAAQTAHEGTEWGSLLKLN